MKYRRRVFEMSDAELRCVVQNVGERSPPATPLTSSDGAASETTSSSGGGRSSGASALRCAMQETIVQWLLSNGLNVRHNFLFFEDETEPDDGATRITVGNEEAAPVARRPFRRKSIYLLRRNRPCSCCSGAPRRLGAASSNTLPESRLPPTSGGEESAVVVAATEFPPTQPAYLTIRQRQQQQQQQPSAAPRFHPPPSRPTATAITAQPLPTAAARPTPLTAESLLLAGKFAGGKAALSERYGVTRDADAQRLYHHHTGVGAANPVACTVGARSTAMKMTLGKDSLTAAAAGCVEVEQRRAPAKKDEPLAFDCCCKTLCVECGRFFIELLRL